MSVRISSGTVHSGPCGGDAIAKSYIKIFPVVRKSCCCPHAKTRTSNSFESIPFAQVDSASRTRCNSRRLAGSRRGNGHLPYRAEVKHFNMPLVTSARICSLAMQYIRASFGGNPWLSPAMRLVTEDQISLLSENSFIVLRT